MKPLAPVLTKPTNISENIVSLFFEQARQHPERIALIDKDDQQVSFGDLAREVRETAAYFRVRGIQPGDRVLIFVPMSLDLYRIVLALFYMGATAVFLDEWVNKKRLALCCELVACKAMIGSRKALALTWFLGPLRRLDLRLDTAYSEDAPEIDMATVAPDDTALITFTTGSTGIPKAADRSHAFLKAQFEALQSEINPQPGEVAMPVLPIVLLINLGAGATSIIADFPARKPERMQPERLLAQMQKHRVVRLTSSPYLVERLAQHLTKHGESHSALRQIFTGGAPVFPSLAKEMLEAFPNARVSVAYGSTEAEPISMALAQDVIKLDQSQAGLYVGQPYRGGEVAIIPVKLSPVEGMTPHTWQGWCLPHGALGEIVVKGPHVLKHYIDNPEAWARNKIRVGEEVWHRTGDSGFLTEEGHLYLTGRCKQLISWNGILIAPLFD